jgi:hypothetical protein
MIETPIYVTHMSVGALSMKLETALVRGSAAARTVLRVPAKDASCQILWRAPTSTHSSMCPMNTV